MNESIIALVFIQIIDVISYLHSKILNTNDDILIYGKYGIIINKNIINYNDKLIFKILYGNIKILSSISIITYGINCDIIFNNNNNTNTSLLIDSLPINIIINHSTSSIKFLVSIIINCNNNNNTFYIYSGNTLSCISPSLGILIYNNNNNKSYNNIATNLE